MSRNSSQRCGARAVVLALVISLVAAAGVASWYRLFSTFAPYDDEGCFLITSRAVARGAPLYDEVHSLYGPAFALADAGFHRAFDLPFDHRVARLRTLVVLLLAAGAAAVLLWRATASILLAVIGSLLTLHHVEKFAAEPGHPQDVAVVLLLVILALGFSFEGDRRVPAAAAAGVGLGLLAMLKLNLAGFALMPLVVVLSVGAGWSWVFALAVLACLAVGPAVTAADLGMPPVWWLLGAWSSGLVVTLAVAALRPPRLGRSGRMALASAAAATTVTAVCCVVTLALGTTPGGLFHGLVLQHRGYLGEFFVPPEISWLALAAGVVVSALAAVAVARRSEIAVIVRLASGLAMVVVPAAAHLAAGFRELTTGLEDRGAEAVILGFATPLVWLVAMPDRSGRGVAPGRLLLALAAVFAALGSYPVAGGQLAAATVLLPLIGLVLVADGLGAHITPAVRTALLATIEGLVVAGLVARLGYLPRLYHELEPLGLPGTAGIRTRADEVDRWHWLTAELADRADTFVFFPSTWNSLYVWTDLDPPTGLNFTDWPGVLTHDEQRRVAAALETFARPHAVWLDVAHLPAGWLAEPLTVYLRRSYHPVASYGPIEILAHNQS